MACIQIEVTNACTHACHNCTRYVRHVGQAFFMELPAIEAALRTLVDFPGTVGLMGGEPTLHPSFEGICELYRQHLPRERRELWTSGFRWDELEPVIHETFDAERISFNSHEAPSLHHPLLVAPLDVVEDPRDMWDLIEDCPVQSHWSASINPRGAWFCECAGGAAMAFGDMEGLPVKNGWWRRPLEDWNAQITYYCELCGGCLPLGAMPDNSCTPVTMSNARRVECGIKNRVFLLSYGMARLTHADIRRLKAEHRPRQYRDFIAHCPEDERRTWPCTH
jgi:hypothetical protein